MLISFSPGAILPSFKRSPSKLIWNIRPDLSTSIGFWLLKYILCYGIRLNFCFNLPTGALYTKQKPEVRLSDYGLWLWASVVCQFFKPRSPFTSKDRSLVSQLGFWYRSDSSWRLLSLRQRGYWLLHSSLRSWRRSYLLLKTVNKIKNFNLISLTKQCNVI